MLIKYIVKEYTEGAIAKDVSCSKTNAILSAKVEFCIPDSIEIVKAWFLVKPNSLALINPIAKVEIFKTIVAIPHC